MFIPFFIFLKNCHTLCYGCCTILHSYQQHTKLQIFPHPCQFFSSSFPLLFTFPPLSSYLPSCSLSFSLYHTHTHSFSLFLSSLLSQRVWSDISLWFWFVFHCLLVTLSIFSYVCYPFVYLLSRNVHSRPLPIFNSYFIFCCSVVELFIYSVCYFFRLPFHSANCAIWCTEVLNFDVIQFISYYFYCLCFWYHIQEIIAKSNVI